jgi:uncharacterized sporulation protein YeaH/YhbH (DUF444 family)
MQTTDRTIIDRRKSADKTSPNRKRFMDRVKEQVEEAVKEAIQEGKVDDLVNGSPKRISIPKDTLDEPEFRPDPETGTSRKVLPGNKDFVPGDEIPKPDSGKSGEEGSPDGSGEDEFVFEIDQEEFNRYFFKGLELPNFIKESLDAEEDTSLDSRGYAKDGVPGRLDVVQTMRRSKARRARRIKKRRQLRKAKEDLEELRKNQPLSKKQQEKKDELEEEIETLKRQIRSIPFIDDTDLRYRNLKEAPNPVSLAVMFCVMDVSGSMNKAKKEIAKRFFMFLYYFLEQNYERVDVVFIRHHSEAKEVDEEEFFYSSETGGTVVSTALELERSIIEERYPTENWNMYCCQVSDGDNSRDDNERVASLMPELLELLQYHAYVQVMNQKETNLWDVYADLAQTHENCVTKHIDDPSRIFDAFRDLFKTNQEG